MKLLSVVAISGLAMGADDTEAIRAALRGFNEAARKAEAQPLRAFFTSDATTGHNAIAQTAFIQLDQSVETDEQLANRIDLETNDPFAMSTDLC